MSWWTLTNRIHNFVFVLIFLRSYLRYLVYIKLFKYRMKLPKWIKISIKYMIIIVCCLLITIWSVSVHRNHNTSESSGQDTSRRRSAAVTSLVITVTLLRHAGSSTAVLVQAGTAGSLRSFLIHTFLVVFPSWLAVQSCSGAVSMVLVTITLPCIA